MKVKLDENLPRSAADPLLASGHDVDTVLDEGLVEKPDPEVLAAATLDGRLLLTLDRASAMSGPTRREAMRECSCFGSTINLRTQW